MTYERKQWFKRNSISLANLILLVGIIITIAKWQQRVDDKLDLFDEHRISDDEHMPFTEKMEIFVPRNEFNRMDTKIDMINDKVDLLLNTKINGN